MCRTRLPRAGTLALAASLLLGAGSLHAGNPRPLGAYNYDPSPPWPYDLMDTAGGYYGGMRYREYYNFSFRDSGFGMFFGPPRHVHPVPPPAPPPLPVVNDPALQALPQDACAHLIVQVPAGAEVWVDGSKTQQTGPSRDFVSPPLAAGRGFSYEVRARWKGEKGDVEQTRQVPVHAGERVNVDFLAAR